MKEREMFDFINKGLFVQTCFREVPLEILFRDEQVLL